MELDFIENINDFGESVVRLYNFNKSEAIKFRNLIIKTILKNKKKLDLSIIDYIEPRNCNLILGLSPTDEGIISADNKTFYCILTVEGYLSMVKLLGPFCEKETKGYAYLYDVDTPIDFLFSPAGTW